MEEYKVLWYHGGTLTDISARAGGISTSDDLDSISVTASADVAQNIWGQYFEPLPIVCGDRLVIYHGGAKAFEGQINTVNGNWSEKITLSLIDDGVILGKNDIIIQFNGVAADAAIKQLCARLGVAVGAMPSMPTKITQIYHEAVSSVLSDILDTVSAETGKQYFIRVRDSKLYVLAYGTTPVTALYKAAGNLGAYPIQNQPGAPTVQSSIDDLRNAVQIYSDKDSSVTVYASASDAASIAKYGRRMKVETYSDSDSATAAQKAKTLLKELNAPSEDISIQTYGADSVTAGTVLAFDLAEFSGNFLVKAVKKDYGEPYTMELTLRRIS